MIVYFYFSVPNYYDGSYAVFYGKNFPYVANRKSFILGAPIAECSVTLLQRKPDGTLTRVNNDLADAVIVSKSIGSVGYISFKNGLIFQWGSVTLNANTATIITYAIKMPYMTIAAIGNDNHSTDEIEILDNTPVKLVADPNNTQNGTVIAAAKNRGYTRWFVIGI